MRLFRSQAAAGTLDKLHWMVPGPRAVELTWRGRGATMFWGDHVEMHGTTDKKS